MSKDYGASIVCDPGHIQLARASLHWKMDDVRSRLSAKGIGIASEHWAETDNGYKVRLDFRIRTIGNKQAENNGL